MLKELKRFFKQRFRELLVYHHRSLEYRAMLLTLMVSHDGEIDACEKEKLKAIARTAYPDDEERAALLVDTVFEFHKKIVDDNGLNFENLVLLVQKETKEHRRYAQKIDLEQIATLLECVDDEDEEKRLFEARILEFLRYLKEEYGEKR